MIKDILSVVVIFGLPILLFLTVAFPIGACSTYLENANLCTPVGSASAEFDHANTNDYVIDTPTPTPTCTPTPGETATPSATLTPTKTTTQQPTLTPTPEAGHSAQRTPTKSYEGPTLIPLRGGSPK